MQSLADDFRRTDIQVPSKLLTGVDQKLHALAGLFSGGHNVTMSFMKQAEAIDNRSERWKSLPDNRIRGAIREFKNAFRRRRRVTDELLVDALAAIREAATRCTGLRPYLVQLAGALALYDGNVVEMATGEGKTLTAALSLVLRGWIGLPCHLITVNDYLAERDMKWMRPLFEYCGVSVGCVLAEMDPEARRAGYRNDVTYTTSKEIIADFLRDRLWLGTVQKSNRRQILSLLGRRQEIDKGTVMRGIHSGIVDEADSVLIDEAVTPLIISAASENDSFIEACRLAHSISCDLLIGEDYETNGKYRDIELKPHMLNRISQTIAGARVTYKSVPGYVELVKQSLLAKEFFHRDDQYVIEDKRIVIVDELTGRKMPMRSWNSGLHQFVEANESLPMTSPTESLARLSFQRFFRFFHHLSGMTGTAKESAQELWDIYELPVVAIPENRVCQRIFLRNAVFSDLELKWKAIVEEITKVHASGRPILVGTRSVKASEELARRLDAANLAYQLLNAVRHKEESLIVALGGEKGQITIATNMAGRGTDIKLGIGVAEIGGLHVIAAECNESPRIDRQLFGRCARQGDPGSARLFVSLEDGLICRYVPSLARGFVRRLLKSRVPGSRILSEQITSLAQSISQRMAYRRRRSVLRTDTWMDDSLSFARKEV